MTRIVVPVSPAVLRALRRAANRDMRLTRDMAAVLIVRGLAEMGELTDEDDEQPVDRREPGPEAQSCPRS